jgi:hypothetical protein
MTLLSPARKHFILNRFPCKDAWDTLAIAQLLLRGDVANATPLSMTQKKACLRFYFDAGGVTRLLAVSNRSGARWLQLAIELALDLQRGGTGEYTFEQDHYYPDKGQLFARLDWRAPSGLWVEQHARASGGPVLENLPFLVTHNNYAQLRTRRAAEMKTVFVTRSIPAIIASLYNKFANIENRAGTSFDWDQYVGKAVDYFNSWGDVMTWHPAIRHYKYEDLKANPLATYMEILNFWGMPVDEANMAEGLFRASKQEMLKRMPSEAHENNLRISTKKKSQRRIIPEDRLCCIIEHLDRDLKYDFGYSFDMDTPYDTVYD